MESYDLVRLIIVILLIGGAVLYSVSKFIKFKNPITSKFITRTAIFSAFATILYIVPYFKFSVPFFPAFLEFHFDEIAVLIAGFAYGPLSAFFVALVKTIIKLPMTTSLGVGELVDFIYSLILAIPAALWYKKRRSLKGAIVGLSIGFIIQVIASSLITSFLILDFYIFVMGFSKELLLAMSQAANPNLTSLGWPFFFYIALPFNALKDVVVILLTLVLYKKIHQVIEKIT
ncbi:MAG: ECF transporter S component [Bacilli bacterium]|jgi:riboflavin transporter FmnP|nr:ECF transporter S component [Bacilli bacterium]